MNSVGNLIWCLKCEVVKAWIYDRDRGVTGRSKRNGHQGTRVTNQLCSLTMTIVQFRRYRIARLHIVVIAVLVSEPNTGAGRTTLYHRD